jgi:flagellar assembly protein FliH
MEMKKRADALDNVIRELGMMKKRIIDEAEEDIIGLSLHVAEKIVHREIDANREVIHHVLQDAMKNVLDRDNIIIRLHPNDYLYVMEIKTDFLQNFDGLKNVSFQKDETIRQGGAVIETQHGEVDARIDQQFREVRQAVQSIQGHRDT